METLTNRLKELKDIEFSSKIKLAEALENKIADINIKDMETGEVSTFDNEYVERISDTELETHDTMLEEQRVNDMNNDGEV